uniref:Uncharacterized protein n=1 Tax=Setaria viridis TaxID=4556 RepID=A0A4U6T1C1_SETVI|nr:hypothetical protein SEVIR_9G287300v2 [Setaria viridis]
MGGATVERRKSRKASGLAAGDPGEMMGAGREAGTLARLARARARRGEAERVAGGFRCDWEGGRVDPSCRGRRLGEAAGVEGIKPRGGGALKRAHAAQLKSLYLDYELIDSHSGWKEKWCYIGNHDPKLPKLTGHHPTWNNRWLDEPTHGDCLQLPELLDRISKLKQEGLIGVRVAFSHEAADSAPAAAMPLGYEYSGVNDPTRICPEELSTHEIMVGLRRMFKNVGEIPTIVQEFYAANPPKAKAWRVKPRRRKNKK